MSRAVAPVRHVGGFFFGAHYPLRAAFFVIRHPSLWPYCIMPILINIAVVVGLVYWLHGYSNAWFQHHLADTGWFMHAVRVAAGWLSILLTFFAALIAFVVVGSLASVPFNDFLSERVDKIQTGWRDIPGETLGRKIWKMVITISQESKRLSAYGILAILLFFLSFIPVLTPFTTAAQLFLSSMFFAVDYLSYPLERRGVLLAHQKKAFAHDHFGASLGFGATMTFIAFIPLVNFLFLPLGVVGGTLLFAELAGEKKQLTQPRMPSITPPASQQLP